MKRYIIFTLAIAVAISFALVQQASAQDSTKTAIVHGPRFVDEDGDGFNDNAPDHDNDGIPNGLDDDYVRPFDGSGAANGNALGRRMHSRRRAMIAEDGAFVGNTDRVRWRRTCIYYDANGQPVRARARALRNP